MAAITMKQLLEAGVHFGHRTRRWNPKMAPYLFGERNGIHIIDLRQTIEAADEATLGEARQHFEATWNRSNDFRTVVAVAVSILLILILLFL